MCRWLAYQGKAIFLNELIYKPEYSLVRQSIDARKAITRVNADGFGLGWYTEQPTPGVFHDVLPAWSDENLKSLANHIHSHRFMAHVRSSTGTSVSRSNCHPFVLDNWMFLHNGQIGEFHKVKFNLERLLPEELHLKRKGTTDSELIFLIMIKNGLQKNPIDAIQKTIDEIELICKQKGVIEPFKASMCISDGKQQLWSVRYSTDLFPPTIFKKNDKNGLILTSEPLDRKPGWKTIDAQTVCHFSEKGATCHKLKVQPTVLPN